MLEKYNEICKKVDKIFKKSLTVNLYTMKNV